MIRYPILALLDIAGTLFACLFLNWWAPAFASPTGWLPNWLAWVQSFDDSLDVGLLPGEVPTHWTRVRWLYRNPAYGWSYWALGVSFDLDEWNVKTFVPADTGQFTFYATGPHGTFNWHGIRWGVRFKFGWKAWNMFDASTGKWKTEPWGPEWRIPIVFSISLAK